MPYFPKKCRWLLNKVSISPKQLNGPLKITNILGIEIDVTELALKLTYTVIEPVLSESNYHFDTRNTTKSLVNAR